MLTNSLLILNMYAALYVQSLKLHYFTVSFLPPIQPSCFETQSLFVAGYVHVPMQVKDTKY